MTNAVEQVPIGYRSVLPFLFFPLSSFTHDNDGCKHIAGREGEAPALFPPPPFVTGRKRKTADLEIDPPFSPPLFPSPLTLKRKEREG